MKSSASQKMKSNPFHSPQRISSRSDFIPSGISFVSPIGETDLIAANGRWALVPKLLRYPSVHCSPSTVFTNILQKLTFAFYSRVVSYS